MRQIQQISIENLGNLVSQIQLTKKPFYWDLMEELEKAGVPMAQAEITMIPQTYVKLTSDEDKKMFQRIMDLLDEDDDVQNVYHNVEEDEE